MLTQGKAPADSTQPPPAKKQRADKPEKPKKAPGQQDAADKASKKQPAASPLQQRPAPAFSLPAGSSIAALAAAAGTLFSVDPCNPAFHSSALHLPSCCQQASLSLLWQQQQAHDCSCMPAAWGPKLFTCDFTGCIVPTMRKSAARLLHCLRAVDTQHS